MRETSPVRRRGQDHHLDRAPDHPWIAQADAVLSGAAESVHLRDTLRNVQRSAGTLLGHEVTRRGRRAPPSAARLSPSVARTETV